MNMRKIIMMALLAAFAIGANAQEKKSNKPVFTTV